ncbi:dihydrofolate reductase family protein, partial [Methylobacterium organophilum]|nr:dihydrofolate reductase family protein [Methylobacterium organophilum]
MALDARGRLDWGARDAIEGDHVVVVLTESVPDSHLRALRAGGQSYLFAGDRAVDFPLAAAKLRALFGIERLLVEGGGHINGSMLKAGLIDELSLLLVPAVDGLSGTPAVFDIAGEEADTMGSRRKLDLTACERLSDAYRSLALISPTGFDARLSGDGPPDGHRGRDWLRRVLDRPP